MNISLIYNIVCFLPFYKTSERKEFMDGSHFNWYILADTPEIDHRGVAVSNGTAKFNYAGYIIVFKEL